MIGVRDGAAQGSDRAARPSRSSRLLAPIPSVQRWIDSVKDSAIYEQRNKMNETRFLSVNLIENKGDIETSQ